MRKTGNSFLSGKSKLGGAKGGGKDSSDSSDDGAKSGRSKATPRKTLLEQQSNVASTISRANFGGAMSDHPSASDEELRRPPAKLGDRTKVDGEAWQVLKKEAMKEKYRLTVEYQRLTPYDKETVGRLIAAQEA